MISLPSVFRWCARLLLTGVVGLALYGAANAGMVSTASVVDSAQAAKARENIKALAQRPELAEQLKAYGVMPDQAEERVNAMTDAEVLALVDNLGDLPAGGAISDNTLILLLVLIILVLAL
jgi:hypothetical protein